MRFSFYARQHIAVARICHANSVRLSVTRVYCIKTAERVLDRGIVTMEDEYKVVCALSNGVIFDDLE